MSDHLSEVVSELKRSCTRLFSRSEDFDMNENSFDITNLTLGDIGVLITVVGVLMTVISVSIAIWYGRKALANPAKVSLETGDEDQSPKQSAELIREVLAYKDREHAEELAAKDAEYGQRLASQERKLAELAKAVEMLRRTDAAPKDRGIEAEAALQRG
ncbi:MAG: hypothetical protein BECKG1743E_GA0114224_106022 [Candidatus Kentron sp. G]|nr:MAG: hypothetical protein BECKG1743E_GA0114224_106022 [Candidatus Kentron sp. G]